MATPTPPVALKDHCSIIYHNALYTYQADAFQSLQLKSGAEWSELPLGVPTNDSTCVQGTADGQDALFIVGGTTTLRSTDYSGLQRFTFHDSKWETLNIAVNVTRDRVLHGSAFLNSSSSILVYGGSQSARTASSETFLISTLPPYGVRALTSKAPPVANPLMMPWNATHALMLGGNAQSKALFTFGPQGGWHPLNVSLPNFLPDSSKVQAALKAGDDGSKVLEIFDLSVSPNTIRPILLSNATHASTSTEPSSSTIVSSTSAAPLGKVTVPPSKKKRVNTVEDPLAYDVTLAPHDTRRGFSLAQGSDGLVVASGGNDQAVLSMFNLTGKQWIDPNQFFGNSKPTNPDSTPSSISPASSVTAGASPSSKPPPSTGMSRNRSLTILGATLGAVFGVAALLVLLLLILRCLRKRRADKRRSSEYTMEDKHDMDFADQGADFMKEAGGSFGKQGDHRRDLSGQSASSAVIMGGRRNSSQQSKRALFHKTKDSDGSAKPFFGRSKSLGTTSPPQISEPFTSKHADQAANPHTSPNPRTEPRTDTGWSRYWNNSSSNINAMAAGPARHGSHSRPTTYASNSQSDYDSSRVTSSQAHESAEVRPLNLSTTHLPSSARIVSPTSGLPLQPGLATSSSNHNEPSTPTTIVSDIDEEDEYRAHHPRSLRPEGTSSWTPVDTSDRSSTWQDRPVSSVHADSMIYPHPGDRVRIPNFPGVPSRRPSHARVQDLSRNPSQGQSSLGRNNSGRGMRSAAAKDFVSPPLPPPTPDPPNTRRVLPGYGAHEIRTFPRREGELGPRGRGGRDTEDMSWLNLGTSK